MEPPRGTSSVARYGCILFTVALLAVSGVCWFGHRLGPDPCARNADKSQHESLFDVMAALVVPFGYSLEEHFVVTEDGYVLRLFRLGGRQPPDPPVSSAALGPVDGTSDMDVTKSTTSAPRDDPVLRRLTASSESEAPGGLLSGDSGAVAGGSSGVDDSHAGDVGGTRTTPGGGAPGRRGPVAFLHHPLMGSSVDFVAMGPGRSLGFMLADAGYDVWLTNVRGNRFSRNHTHLDPDAPSDVAAFWSFSWDEHAALDLPAALDLVAAVTGQQEGFLLVGYSQGTTVALAALSSQPRVVRRLAAAALLAPVAFVTYMTSPLFKLMVRGRVERAFNLMGLHEYGGHSPQVAALSARFCGAHPRPCAAYLELLCGTNPTPGGNLDPAMVPTIMRFLPSGTSVQNMAHWGQVVRSPDPFRLPYFDYGTDCSRKVPVKGGVRVGGQYPCNQAAYNSTTPPAYPLFSITTPLALFAGGHDALADPVDVALLLRVLQQGPGGGAVQLIHDEPDYGHLDFGVGQDAADRIYPLVLAFLRQHTPR